MIKKWFRQKKYIRIYRFEEKPFIKNEMSFLINDEYEYVSQKVYRALI